MNTFRPRFVNATVTVSLSSVTATSAKLTPGWWRVWCTELCFLRQGGSTVTAATATATPLGSQQETYIYVSDDRTGTDAYIAGILSSGTATLYLTKQ